MVVGSHAVIEGRDGLRVSGQSLPHLWRGAGQGSLLPLGSPFLIFQIVLLPDKLKRESCFHELHVTPLSDATKPHMMQQANSSLHTSTASSIAYTAWRTVMILQHSSMTLGFQNCDVASDCWSSVEWRPEGQTDLALEDVHRKGCTVLPLPTPASHTLTFALQHALSIHISNRAGLEVCLWHPQP